LLKLIPVYRSFDPFHPDNRCFLHLHSFVTVDRIYRDWFVNILRSNTNATALTYLPNVHFWLYSFIDRNGEKHIKCKWCMYALTKINNVSVMPRRIIAHSVRTGFEVLREILGDVDNWCEICHVVPLVQLHSAEHCANLLGSYFHTCSCEGDSVCIDCFGDYRREFNWTVNTDLPNIDILKYQEPLPWFPRARRQLHF
jgi:hypothetical protein